MSSCNVHRFNLLRLKLRHSWRPRKANVNTLTPLASTFNRQNFASRDISAESAGLFCIKELTSPEGFHFLKEDVLRKSERIVNEVIAKSPSSEVISLFDHLSNELCKVADLAEFVRAVHPVKEFAQEAQNASFEIGGYVEKLNTHQNLFRSLDITLNECDLEHVVRTVGDLFRFDFEQSGIHLEESKRHLAVQLHEAVLVLGARFAQNSTQPTMFPAQEWPVHVRIPFELNSRSQIVVDSSLSDSSESALREISHKAFMRENDEQSQILDHLLYARHQLAKVLGFSSFPHRTLKATMAADPTTVCGFLESTLNMVQPLLDVEVRDIEMYKKTVGHDHALRPWDIRYYTSLITAEKFNISAAKVSEYFSVGACMEGLNLIFTALFGVSLHAVEAARGELWARGVQKVEVRHETDGLLGYIYCDFYQRTGKIQQDCHYTIRGGKLLSDGTYQLPVVALVCNFPPPSSHTPSLLSQGMVENLFHEMGHAMHSMIGRARFHHVTGTRCATDFAEVPSVLMEYFAKDRRVLPLFAKHYETGQSLPPEMMTAIIGSRNQFSSVGLHTQAFYSIVDQKIHNKHSLATSTMDVVDELQKQYSPITHVPGSAWHLRFSHFHSYGAKYYAYVWCKAVASEIWHTCFERDPLSRGAGERYKETMLKHGGGCPPQQMLENMLGRRFSSMDMVNALETDLKAH